MNRLRRNASWCSGIAAIVCLPLLGTITANHMHGTRHHSSSAARCRSTQIPVHIPHHLGAGRLTARACIPPAHHRNGTLILAVPGGGEPASYFDPVGVSTSRSFARTAADRGYATVALDRLGTGGSTRPHSTTATWQAQVATVHQAAQLLHRRWHRVIGLGHSLGSGTIAGVASQHPHDLDAVALTGYGPTVAQPGGSRHHTPARNVADKWTNLDSGWITTRPQDLPRSGLFDGGNMNHRAWRYVRDHQDVLSQSELNTRPQKAAARAMAARIHTPTLLADGDHDSHYCLAASGKPAHHCDTVEHFRTWAHHFIPHARHLIARVLPTGHSWAYEAAAPAATHAILNWADHLSWHS